jgi:exonuclease SbcC
LKAQISSFERELVAHDIAGDYGTAPIEQLLIDREAAAEREAQILEQRIHELRTQLEPTRKRLADRRTTWDSRQAEHDAKESRLLAVQGQIRATRIDPRLSKVSMETGAHELEESAHAAGSELEKLMAELASHERCAAQLKETISACKTEANTLRGELRGLRDQASTLQRRLTEIAARLQQGNLAPGATEAMVLERVARESRNQAALLELIDAATAVEVALDTVSTAAAFSRLHQGVVTKENAIATARERGERLQPWSKYFESLLSLVVGQQNQATDEFTRGYGPRTSVIQKRLRSVYGFDEVEIRSHDSRIQVRVKRGSEELRPTDYFSQSQQQTLLLGLFLTACLSQTWSSLSPILLDDPVTHFDDLNTYAFLDLVVGLVESDPGRHQFVISTCDDRFLQLARQKFRHLADRSTFYKFTAIGPEGPTVEQIKAIPKETVASKQ